MKLKYLVIIIFVATNLAGCSAINSSSKVSNKSDNISTSKELSGKSKENTVIRAEGISKFGKIIITPNGEEKVGKLGTDSSYGKASDYTFNADYNIIFSDLSNKKTNIGRIKQDSFASIIQPKNSTIEMQKLIMDKHELFIFIPQYAGSNDVPLYIFCVDKNGKAYQLKFEFDSKSALMEGASIITSNSPKFELPAVEENMLIIKTLMSVSINSPDLKFYKLTFELNGNVLILRDKSS